MDKQQVKLVKSENGGDQYHILINRVVGKGGFGIVNEARSLQNPKQRLVVKTMKITDQDKKKNIQKQLKLMSDLPLHQNLVQVIPVKMYSANNYYIFMEYCDGGTLYSQYVQKKKRNYKEQELYDIFYQCMNGYKVLFDRKILHQDIKPENILIRKNFYKLADFGLSLFYEGYDFGLTREGTMSYIAPQKLTIKNYVGNHKSDIYSFGVMFYELIAGHHPYIKTKKSNHKQFIMNLVSAKLAYPANLQSRYSLKFHTFFDIILRMVKKTEAARISFDEIWEYIKNSDLFQKARQQQKQKSKQFILQQYDFVVAQVTNVLTLPVDTSPQKQQILRKQFEKRLKQVDEKMIQSGKQVANYFIRKRLIVYYLDRLTRKLIVQQLKSDAKSEIYDRTILYLMLFTKCILNDLVSQLQTPKSFSTQSLDAFRKTNFLSMDITNLLRKDHEYVMDSLSQLLSETSSLHKKEIKQMFQIYKKNDQQTLIKNLSQNLNKLLSSKTDFIEVTNKAHLVTLVNILTIISMLDDFSKATYNAQILENSDKNVLMSSTPELIGMIETKCAQKGLVCGFDMTGVFQQQNDLLILGERLPE